MRVYELLQEQDLEEGIKQKLGAAALAAGLGLGVPAYKYYTDQARTNQTSAQTSAQELEKIQKLYPERKRESEDARSPLFYKRLQEVAKELSVDPRDLLKVMHFETKGTLDPSITNKIGATGLIQFMPNTARVLGTSIEDLRNMSAVKQLDYVLKYYKIKKLPPGARASDIYLSTFMPAVVVHNKPDNFILGARGQYKIPVFKSISAQQLNRGSVWKQNPVFWENKEIKKRGYFTVGDIRRVFDSR